MKDRIEKHQANQRLYLEAVKWIDENPKDERLSDAIKQLFLGFNQLPAKDKLILINELNKTTGLPEKIKESLPWLTYGLDDLPLELVEKIGDDSGAKLEPIDKRNVASALRLASFFKQPSLLDIFLQRVAFGMQNNIEKLFEIYKGDDKKIQGALLHREKFTDYSDRTFNCTAYEYAYWAKDTHMCRMLERYMNEDTKVVMLAHVDNMERIDEATNQPIGLVYIQKGKEHHSAHFDFTPLKKAYERYINAYEKNVNPVALKAALMEIGMAQRDMPVHVVNEYCNPERSFDPTPEFNEGKLSRNVKFFDHKVSASEPLFPLEMSASSGLGIDTMLVRGDLWMQTRFWEPPLGLGDIELDFKAVSKLDEVRTLDLTCSRDNLQPKDMESGHSLVV